MQHKNDPTESRYRKYLCYIRDEMQHRPKLKEWLTQKEFEQRTRQWIWRIHDLTKGALREQNEEAQIVLGEHGLSDYLPGVYPDDVSFEELHNIEYYVPLISTAMSPEYYDNPQKFDAAILLDIYVVTYNMLEDYPDSLNPRQFKKLNDFVKLLSETDYYVVKSYEEYESLRSAKGGTKHCIALELSTLINQEFDRETVSSARTCWNSIKKNYSEDEPFCIGKYSFYIVQDRLVYRWDNPQGKLDERSMGFSTFQNKVTLAKKD